MAYQLSSEGYKTVVIDKRDVGTGSTCATTAMIQYELDEPLHSLIDKHGRGTAGDIYTGAADAVNRLGQLVHDLNIDCGFQDKRSLLFANSIEDSDGLRKEYECRKMVGMKVSWLSRDEVLSGYGVVSEGGILSEVAASMDAYQFTHALLAGAGKTGRLEVYDHTALTSVEHGYEKNFVVTDTTAMIECNKIVYASGYETHSFIKSGIGRLISTYACISEPVDHLPTALRDTIFWNTEEPYLYFRTTPDNRILVGGEDEEFKNPTLRNALIERKERQIVRKFGRVIPDLSFVVDFSWAGTFGATKDSLPYIGAHPDFPNSYFMLGFGGNGITFSVMGMQILSDALAGKHNKFLEYFRFGR